MCTPSHFKQSLQEDLLKKYDAKHDFDDIDLSPSNSIDDEDQYRKSFSEEFEAPTTLAYDNPNFSFGSQNQLQKREILSVSTPFLIANEKLEYFKCLPDWLPENVIGEIGEIGDPPLNMPCASIMLKRCSLTVIIASFILKIVLKRLSF